MNVRVEGKQKRAHATRAHILDCFEVLMQSQSFDEISIAQIAASAEVGKGTVLAHFSEKLALAATLFAQELEKCQQQIEASAQISSAAKLRSIFTPFFNLIMRDDVYVRLIVGEGQNLCRQMIEPAEARLFDSLARRLDVGRPAQELDVIAVRGFLVHAAVMYRACDAGEAVIEEFESLLAHYLFQNLASSLQCDWPVTHDWRNKMP